MLKYRFQRILNIQLIRIQPVALRHQKREVLDPARALNTITLQQLIFNQIHLVIQFLIKAFQIALPL